METVWYWLSRLSWQVAVTWALLFVVVESHFLCVDWLQDYESKISTLQEQLERHSMMSSMTFEDFDADDDDDLGWWLLLQLIYVVSHCCGLWCGSVAEWLGRWTCDQQVTGSNPSRPAIECNHGQVVSTDVPLSPRSIIWYQPVGDDAFATGKVTLGLASHLPPVTDISGSPPTGPRPGRGRWADPHSLVEHGWLTLLWFVLQCISPVWVLGSRPHIDFRVERIDPIHFLAECRKRRLIPALSVLSLILRFLWGCFFMLARITFIVLMLFCIFFSMSSFSSCSGLVVKVIDLWWNL